MTLNTDHIRLIFGLKLKQLRQERGMSLNDLSAKSGLSMSYINEIEKGKKYPKTDKIFSLATALDIDYDNLVSLKLSKKLEPISNLLNSNFLTEIPFDFFGIDPASLLEMLSNAPTKLSAFINTIIKIGKSYSMSVEDFYFAVLRSYQEMHDNYFPELEDEAEKFLSFHKISKSKQVDEFLLTNILTDTYGVKIKYFDEVEFPKISNIRSIYIPKSKTLMINKRITSDQRAFTLGRELGFISMNLKERPYTSSWISVNSFDEVFNNFKASYFAGAILIRREPLIDSLTDFFNQTKFSVQLLEKMIKEFQATPETLIRRMSNILTSHFKIDKIFFLRFEVTSNSSNYQLTKELHLAKLHNPQESINENYCRRWISLKILKDLATQQQSGTKNTLLIDAQISEYPDSQNKYLVIGMARPLNIIKSSNISVSIGFEIDDDFKSKVKFINDSKIQHKKVGHTCEKCSIFDCQERVAAPTTLQKSRNVKEIIKEIENLH